MGKWPSGQVAEWAAWGRFEILHFKSTVSINYTPALLRGSGLISGPWRARRRFTPADPQAIDQKRRPQSLGRTQSGKREERSESGRQTSLSQG